MGCMQSNSSAPSMLFSFFMGRKIISKSFFHSQLSIWSVSCDAKTQSTDLKQSWEAPFNARSSRCCHDDEAFQKHVHATPVKNMSLAFINSGGKNRIMKRAQGVKAQSSHCTSFGCMFLTNPSKHLKFLRPGHSRCCYRKTWLALFLGYSLQQGGHTVQRGYANEERAGNWKSRHGRGVCWHFTAEWCEGWWVTPGIKCYMLPRGETASWCMPPQSGWWVRAVFMEGPHIGHSQGEESRRERWKSNYFFFLLSTIPMLAIMCQTNKSGEKKKNWAAQSFDAPPAGKSPSANLRPLHLLGVSATVFTYPSSTSLSGAILVLFCERASSSTYHMRFVPIKNLRSTETPLTYLIKTSHGVLQHCTTFVLEASHYTCSPGYSAHCGLAA